MLVIDLSIYHSNSQIFSLVLGERQGRYPSIYSSKGSFRGASGNVRGRLGGTTTAWTCCQQEGCPVSHDTSFHRWQYDKSTTHLTLLINCPIHSFSVLLSTIINTVAPGGRRFSVSKQIKTASLLAGLDNNSDLYMSVKNLLSDLLQSLHPQIDFDRHCPPEFRRLKKRVWTMLCDTPEKTAAYTTLQIVNQIILWIELRMFESPTSEQVYVTAWSLIFNILLLDTNIRAIP